MKKAIYVFSNGRLARKDDTIFLETENGKKYLPVEGISEMLVFGEVDVNKRFLEFACQKEIILHFFNYYGYYVGTFYPREHYNSGYMVLRQAEHYIDPSKRLRIAGLIVLGALRNMRQALRYYSNRGVDLGATLQDLEKDTQDLAGCADVEQLMAVEGRARERYYKAFDKIIDQPGFGFRKRTRRPPENRLNALLSFGNSVLYTAVLSEIYKTHLDPRIGFLHATNFRRFTLNLDVAEVFKPIIVDRTIFALLGKRVIGEDDFEEESGGVFMNAKAKQQFVQHLDEKMATTIEHRELGRSVSYRRLIRMDLYKLEKHLIGEKEYSPFVARW